MSDEKNQGIFLDGKNQVLELFRHMEQKHKATLLKHLKNRNPALAKELSENCISYENIWSLEEETLKIILANITPVIVGLALYLEPSVKQRHILGLLPRAKAMQAYDIMTKDLNGNRRECQKAQAKILETAKDLSRRKAINFY